MALDTAGVPPPGPDAVCSLPSDAAAAAAIGTGARRWVGSHQKSWTPGTVSDVRGGGARDVDRARDRERPHAVGLLQRGDGLEGEIEGLPVVLRGLQKRESRGLGIRCRRRRREPSEELDTRYSYGVMGRGSLAPAEASAVLLPLCLIVGLAGGSFLQRFQRYGM